MDNVDVDMATTAVLAEESNPGLASQEAMAAPANGTGSALESETGSAPASPTGELKRTVPAGISHLESLARQKAAEHGLDIDLVATICSAASNWDPWKAEYDGIFYVSQIAPLVENRVMKNLTEARTRAFRWGLMGILGHRARLAGYEGRLAELLDPNIGLEIGCRLLLQMLSSAPEGTEIVKCWRTWQARGF